LCHRNKGDRQGPDIVSFQQYFRCFYRGIIMKKIILLLIAAAFGGYLLFLAMPGLYFNRSLSYKSFTIRTRGPLPEKVEEVLDRAYEKISASGLYRPETRFNIYLPETRKEFLFFTPMQKGDFYRSNPYNGAIFLAASDFGADRVRTESGASEYHVLSIEIVAAAAREIIRSSLPALTYLVLADWKLRGYAERLSGGTGEFKPEYSGKMNFYLSAVDDQMRHLDDHPSIGLLLCKEKDRLTVEYALRDVKKPIGVAEWRTRLVESLPKQLQGKLPTIEQIERELGGNG